VVNGGGAYSILWFWLERGGDRTKHYQKMKRRQRSCLNSMGRKCDIARQHGNANQRRGGTGEGKEKRRCKLGWCESYWTEK
jgi:hypothetical protein